MTPPETSTCDDDRVPTADQAPAAAQDPAIVVVQRHWNDWRTAMVRVADLHHVHWFQPPGAPRPLIHASVECTCFISGDPLHECQATPGPHAVLVCLLRSHTAPAVFDHLASLADQQGRIDRPAIAIGAQLFRAAGRPVIRRATPAR